MCRGESSRARTERDVVLLEHAGGVGLGVRPDNCAITFSGERVGRVVDAGELDADGNVEVGLDRREGHRVEHHTLQVTRKFRGAGKVDELQRVNGFGV